MSSSFELRTITLNRASVLSEVLNYRSTDHMRRDVKLPNRREASKQESDFENFFLVKRN